jgi:hypothetical protein
VVQARPAHLQPQRLSCIKRPGEETKVKKIAVLALVAAAAIALWLRKSVPSPY